MRLSSKAIFTWLCIYDSLWANPQKVVVAKALHLNTSGAQKTKFNGIANYVFLFKELENLALTYPGVNKAFAIQAGRELRIIVESEKVSDQQAGMLAFDISQRIENEMTYPGQVKVVVIREYRAVGTAK